MKNFAIGFLACTCLFLMTASTKDINDILETPDELIKKIFNEGRSSQFQVTATKNQLYMINNKTGILYEWNKSRGQWFRLGNKKKWIRDK